MKLRYFAWVRERIGKPEEEVEVPAGIDQRGLPRDRARQRIEQVDDRPRDLVRPGRETHRYAAGDILVELLEPRRAEPLLEPAGPDIAGRDGIDPDLRRKHARQALGHRDQRALRRGIGDRGADAEYARHRGDVDHGARVLIAHCRGAGTDIWNAATVLRR